MYFELDKVFVFVLYTHSVIELVFPNIELYSLIIVLPTVHICAFRHRAFFTFHAYFSFDTYFFVPCHESKFIWRSFLEEYNICTYFNGGELLLK